MQRITKNKADNQRRARIDTKEFWVWNYWTKRKVNWTITLFKENSWCTKNRTGTKQSLKWT